MAWTPRSVYLFRKHGKHPQVSRTSCVLALTLAVTAAAAVPDIGSPPAGPPEGFVPLFNGNDLDGWTLRQPDNHDWTIVDGVIDCDPHGEAKGDRNLWTRKEYGDFELLVLIDFDLNVTVFTWTNGHTPLWITCCEKATRSAECGMTSKRLEARRSSPVARRSSPVARRSSPVARHSSPVARGPWLAAPPRLVSPCAAMSYGISVLCPPNYPAIRLRPQVCVRSHRSLSLIILAAENGPWSVPPGLCRPAPGPDWAPTATLWAQRRRERSAA